MKCKQTRQKDVARKVFLLDIFRTSYMSLTGNLLQLTKPVRVQTSRFTIPQRSKIHSSLLKKRLIKECPTLRGVCREQWEVGREVTALNCCEDYKYHGDVARLVKHDFFPNPISFTNATTLPTSKGILIFFLKKIQNQNAHKEHKYGQKLCNTSQKQMWHESICGSSFTVINFLFYIYIWKLHNQTKEMSDAPPLRKHLPILGEPFMCSQQLNTPYSLFFSEQHQPHKSSFNATPLHKMYLPDTQKTCSSASLIWGGWSGLHLLPALLQCLSGLILGVPWPNG